MVGRRVTFTESATQAVVVGAVPDEPLGFAERDITEHIRSLVDRTPVLVLASPDDAAGTGKTQIAAACARSAIAADRGLVAWVNAESADTMHAGLAAVADRLGLNGSGDSAGASVRRYLEKTPGPHLVVFDNLGDPAALEPMLPTCGDARIIVTGAAPFGETVAVGPFSRPESIDYLRRRAQLDDTDGADLLAGTLGDAPLALTAAAAAIRLRRRFPERRLTYQGCVQELGAGGLDAAVALAVDAALLDDFDGNLRRVLSSLAVLPPGGVTLRALRRLTEADDCGPESVDMAVDNCLRAALVGYSVDRDTVLMHRSVAAVLRDRLTGAGELDDALETARALIEPETDSSPAARMASAWLERMRLARLEQATDVKAAHEPGRAEPAREELAAAYLAAGQHDRAIELWRDLMAERTRTHGNLDPRTMTAVHGLATAYYVAGDHDSSISVYKSALSTSAQGHGEDHPETLSWRQHLARAMLSAQRTDAAITLLQNTIAGRERVLGADHPDTVAAREYLASVHERNGKHELACTLLEPGAAALYGEGAPDRNAVRAGGELVREYVAAERYGDALVLYERLLADAEQHIGDTDEDADRAAGNLRFLREQIGICLFQTKQYQRAVPVLRQALSEKKFAYGRHHPHALYLSNWLALALLETGQAAEALVLLERCVEGSIRILGPINPKTVAARKWLVEAYRRHPDGMAGAVATLEHLVGDYERVHGPTALVTLNEQKLLVTMYLGEDRLDDAIRLLARTVDGFERSVGSGDLRTHAVRRLLARLYRLADRYAEAIAVLELDLVDLGHSLGADAEVTVAVRTELATALAGTGQVPKAIELFEANVRLQTQALGAAHADTLRTRETLGSILGGIGDHANAAIQHATLYTHREQILGAEHPDTLATAHHLAGNYFRTGKESAAVALWERTLARREQALGLEHPDTLDTRDNLGLAYLKQRRYEEAVPLLELSLGARRRTQGPDDRRTLTTEGNLASAYSGVGRVDEAFELQIHTLRLRENKLGSDHPDTLTSQNNLAMALMDARRYDDGLSLAEQTLATRERVLGPTHPDTMISRSNLGTYYHTVGRYEQSIALLQHTLDDRTRVLGPDHPDTRNSRTLLDQAMAAASRRRR